MSLGHSPRIVTDGLVLLLDAANPRSYPGTGTTWTDLSGNGNHATLINSPTWNTRESFTFNGINQYATLTSIPKICQNLYSSTVEIIAYRTNNTSPSLEVMFGGGVQNTNAGYYFGFRNSASNFMLAYYSNDQDGSTPKSNVAWNSYVGTYDTTTASRYRYFNGSLLSPSQSSGVSNTSASQFYIGAFNDVGTPVFYFSGKIASIKIYSRTLTQSEITQNFAAMRGRYGI